MTTRVLIVDDQALVRAGFRLILQTQEDFAVIAEAADGREATRLAGNLLPDVVLMDVRMPGLDGISATRLITSLDGPQPVRVVILTTYDLDEYVFDALAAGASGFLLNRRGTHSQREHGEDARCAPPPEARRARPGSSGDLRIRDGRSAAGKLTEPPRAGHGRSPVDVPLGPRRPGRGCAAGRTRAVGAAATSSAARSSTRRWCWALVATAGCLIFCFST